MQFSKPKRCSVEWSGAEKGNNELPFSEPTVTWTLVNFPGLSKSQYVTVGFFQVKLLVMGHGTISSCVVLARWLFPDGSWLCYMSNCSSDSVIPPPVLWHLHCLLTSPLKMFITNLLEMWSLLCSFHFPGQLKSAWLHPIQLCWILSIVILFDARSFKFCCGQNYSFFSTFMVCPLSLLNPSLSQDC